jgi:hypothetical protein
MQVPGGIKAPEGAGQAVRNVVNQRLQQQCVHEPRDAQADESVAHKGGAALVIIGARRKVAGE